MHHLVEKPVTLGVTDKDHHPERIALAYSVSSKWRNRTEFTEPNEG